MLQFYEMTFYSILVLLTIFIFKISLDKKLPTELFILWIFCAYSSAYPAFNIFYNPKEYLNTLFLTASKVTAGQSLVLILLLPCLVLYVEKYFLKNLLKAFFVFEAATVIIFGKTLTMGWDSFSSVMLALSTLLFIPPTHKKIDYTCLVLIWVASILNLSVTAGLIYIFMGSVLLWKNYKYKVLIALSIGTGIFIYRQPVELINGNGRFPMWTQYIELWWDKLPKFLGIGLGTWEWVAPSISGTGYMIVHNDFLQIIFETGLVGFFLFLAVLIMLFRRRKSSTRFILSFGSFFIAMMFYFPLHVIPGQVLALYYMFHAHEEQWE